MARLRVYVAGPISKGVLADNVRQATEAGIKLLKAGFAPLVPHLTCYMAGPQQEILPAGTTNQDWYDVDLPWVAVSDAILRLPGESRGADLEEREAHRNGVPVFYNVEHLIAAKDHIAEHSAYRQAIRHHVAAWKGIQ